MSGTKHYIIRSYIQQIHNINRLSYIIWGFNQPVTVASKLENITQTHDTTQHPNIPASPTFTDSIGFPVPPFLNVFFAAPQVLRFGLPGRPPVLRGVKAWRLGPRCAPAVRQGPPRRGHGEIGHGEPLAPLRRGGKGVKVDPSSPGNSWPIMAYVGLSSAYLCDSMFILTMIQTCAVLVGPVNMYPCRKT